MKFEEALVALREDKKIWHPTFADDEYLCGCYVSLPGEDFEEIKKTRDISIVRIKGDRQHDCMTGKFNYVVKILRDLKKVLTEEDYKKYHKDLGTQIEISKIFDEDVFMYPQLNLFLVISDEWEIYNG